MTKENNKKSNSDNKSKKSKSTRMSDEEHEKYMAAHRAAGEKAKKIREERKAIWDKHKGDNPQSLEENRKEYAQYKEDSLHKRHKFKYQSWGDTVRFDSEYDADNKAPEMFLETFIDHATPSFYTGFKTFLGSEKDILKQIQTHDDNQKKRYEKKLEVYNKQIQKQREEESKKDDKDLKSIDSNEKETHKYKISAPVCPLPLLPKRKEYIEREKKGIHPNPKDYEENKSFNITMDCMYIERIYASSLVFEDEMEYDHLNVWDWSYDMHADSFECEVLWVKYSSCQGRKDENGEYKWDEHYVRFIRPVFVNLTYKDYLGDNKDPLNFGTWGIDGMFVRCSDDDSRSGMSLFVVDRFFDSEKELKRDIDFPLPLDFSSVFDEIFGDG